MNNDLIQKIDEGIVALILERNATDYENDEIDTGLIALRLARKELFPSADNKLSVDFRYDYGKDAVADAEKFLETGEF